MSRFVFQDQRNFVVNKKSFSSAGDQSFIKDVISGVKEFQAKKKQKLFHAIRILMDGEGSEIYKYSGTKFSLLTRIQVMDSETGMMAYLLRKQTNQSATKIGVWRGTSDQGEAYLNIEMNAQSQDFVISDVAKGVQVGHISKKLVSTMIPTPDMSRYIIQIEPGYDAALFVLLGLIFDEFCQHFSDRASHSRPTHYSNHRSEEYRGGNGGGNYGGGGGDCGGGDYGGGGDCGGGGGDCGGGGGCG